MKKNFSIILISLVFISSHGQSKKQLVSTIERMKNDSIYLRNLINNKNEINDIARKEIDKKNNEILKINNSLKKQILLSSNFKVTISNQKKLIDSLESQINELDKKMISSKNLFSSYDVENCLGYDMSYVFYCYDDSFPEDGIYKSSNYRIDSNGDSIQTVTLKIFLNGNSYGSWITFENNKIVEITFDEKLSAEIYESGKIKKLSNLYSAASGDAPSGKILCYGENGALLKEEIIEFGEVVKCTGKCD